MNDTSDISKEQLSAWLDDELGTDESRFLLRRLSADDTLQRRLAAYVAIGEVMRGTGVGRHDLAARVHGALASEPAHRAEPERAGPPDTGAAANGGHGHATGLGGRLAPLAAVAVAATVAVVALLVVVPERGGAPLDGGIVDAAAGDGSRDAFPVVPDGVPALEPRLVGVPGNATFASYLMKHRNTVNTGVQPDFVSAQQVFEHIDPPDRAVGGRGEGVTPVRSAAGEEPR